MEAVGGRSREEVAWVGEVERRAGAAGVEKDDVVEVADCALRSGVVGPAAAAAAFVFAPAQMRCVAAGLVA